MAKSRQFNSKQKEAKISFLSALHKKSKPTGLDFFICAAGTTSFSRRLTSLPLAAQINDVAPCANDVLRNDVMLRINDVALRANNTHRRRRCFIDK